MNKIDMQGLSLFSLLISLLLSSLIIALLIIQYTTFKFHHQYMQTTLDNLLELQEVSQLIRTSIRQAGFTPCLNIKHLESLDARNGQMHLLPFKIGVNRLQISRMSNDFSPVHTFISKNELRMSSVLRDWDDVVVIADCSHAEVHQVLKRMGNTKEQIIMLTKPLLYEYHPPVFIGAWIEESFFIHKNRTNLTSLYYENHHVDELMPGVKSIAVDKIEQKRHDLLKVMLQSLQFSWVIEAMVRG